MVLDLENTSRPTRTPYHPRGNSRSHSNDEPSKSIMGSPSNSQRTPETWNGDFSSFRRQIHDPTSEATIPNMENIPQQSRVPTCFHRLLHRAYRVVSDSLRLHRSRA